MDQDGGVDDLLSLMLLLTIERVELLGVAITPADCYLPYALESTGKILQIFGRTEVEIAGGELHGVNAFPPDWRAQPHIINALPRLLEIETVEVPTASQPAHHFLAQKLREAPRPVTILMTGPASNLAAALTAEPALKAQIEEVVWMAGAIDVPGNVRTFAHDGSAEWNAFWDPPAARTVMEADLKLTLFPLDATNNVPVGLDFLRKLAKQRRYPISALAGQFWATTVNTIPHYDYRYFMWDILATSYLGHPAVMSFRQLELAVVERGPNAGQTVYAPGAGRWVKTADEVAVEAFHNYILAQFRR